MDAVDIGSLGNFKVKSEPAQESEGLCTKFNHDVYPGQHNEPASLPDDITNYAGKNSHISFALETERSKLNVARERQVFNPSKDQLYDPELEIPPDSPAKLIPQLSNILELSHSLWSAANSLLVQCTAKNPKVEDKQLDRILKAINSAATDANFFYAKWKFEMEKRRLAESHAQACEDEIKLLRKRYKELDQKYRSLVQFVKSNFPSVPLPPSAFPPIVDSKGDDPLPEISRDVRSFLQDADIPNLEVVSREKPHTATVTRGCNSNKNEPKPKKFKKQALKSSPTYAKDHQKEM